MNRLVIEFDGEELNIDVPTSWDEVTVEKAAIHSSIKVHSGMTTYDYFKEVMSVMSEIEGTYDADKDEVIGSLSADEYEACDKWLEFLKENSIGEDKESIMVEGEEFFIKNDFNKLGNAEIISLNMIQEKHKSNLNYAIPELLCIFLRKKKANGKLETFRSSFMERAPMFKNVIVTDVNRLFLFFLNGKSLFGLNSVFSSPRK